jgi:hypothetical protein
MAVASADVLTDFQVKVLNDSSNAFAQPLNLPSKFQAVQEDVVTLNADVAVLEALAVATHSPVIAATTTTLPACTYANGTAGVGATLTGNANGALAAQDGVTLTAGQRLLVKDQAAPAQNGVYTVTVVGAGGAPFVLTRATDFDTSAEIIDGATFFVGQGTTLANSAFALTVNGAVTVGTTGLVFAQTGGVSFPGTQVAYATADGSKNKIPDAADTVSAALDGLDVAMPYDNAQAPAAAADRITNLAVETAFATTYTLPANAIALGTVWDVMLQVNVAGVTGTPDLTIALKLDGTAAASLAITSVAAGNTYLLKFRVTGGGAGASVPALVETSTVKTISGTGTLVTASLLNAAFNTTTTHVVSATATWSAASTDNQADLRFLTSSYRLAAAVS